MFSIDLVLQITKSISCSLPSVKWNTLVVVEIEQFSKVRYPFHEVRKFIKLVLHAKNNPFHEVNIFTKLTASIKDHSSAKVEKQYHVPHYQSNGTPWW
jgi:hypothetical protein